MTIRKLIRADGTEQFGRWTVIGVAPSRLGRGVVRARCQCGVERDVLRQHLLNGESRSCGCLHKEVQAARFLAMARTHGLARTGSWNSWAAMKARCSNPNHKDFKHYGGRGIQVCERWSIFENFHADMGDRPEGMSIDRMDNDGHYTPGNCKWSTQREQVKNARKPSGSPKRQPNGTFARGARRIVPDEDFA